MQVLPGYAEGPAALAAGRAVPGRTRHTPHPSTSQLNPPYSRLTPTSQSATRNGRRAAIHPHPLWGRTDDRHSGRSEIHSPLNSAWGITDSGWGRSDATPRYPWGITDEELLIESTTLLL